MQNTLLLISRNTELRNAPENAKLAQWIAVCFMYSSEYSCICLYQFLSTMIIDNHRAKVPYCHCNHRDYSNDTHDHAWPHSQRAIWEWIMRTHLLSRGCLHSICEISNANILSIYPVFEKKYLRRVNRTVRYKLYNKQILILYQSFLRWHLFSHLASELL